MVHILLFGEFSEKNTKQLEVIVLCLKSCIWWSQYSMKKLWSSYRLSASDRPAAHIPSDWASTPTCSAPTRSAPWSTDGSTPLAAKTSPSTPPHWSNLQHNNISSFITARKRNLPRLCPPGRYPPPGQAPPHADTLLSRHPPCTVHAGIRSTRGRYASHWNAFLFKDLKFYSRRQLPLF